MDGAVTIASSVSGCLIVLAISGAAFFKRLGTTEEKVAECGKQGVALDKKLDKYGKGFEEELKEQRSTMKSLSDNVAELTTDHGERITRLETFVEVCDKTKGKE